jgi:DNA-binding NarL/FixJ family response regulator
VAPLRVLIVDDHPAVAAGLGQVLEGGGFEVTGVATSLEELGRVIGDEPPDVVVCDVMLGDAPIGLDLPRWLRARGATGTAVLFFSSFDNPWFQRRALADGAAGYVVKTTPTDELVAAVRAVGAGGTAFSASAVRAARSGPRPPSARERSIIGLLATGAANREIAGALGISPKTVESHLARLFTRYGVTTRTELAMLATAQGWITSPRP